MTDDKKDRPEYPRDAEDPPQARSFEEWVKAWHRWFLKIPEAKHPTLTSSPKERLQDQDQNDPKLLGLVNFDKKDERRVWFLAGGYGGSINTRSFIPTGRWYVLAPVFTVFASQEEYPSLDSTTKLNKFCEEDVEYAEVKAELDGQGIIPYHIKIDRLFSVTLPEKNILGLPMVGPRRTSTRTINIVAEGYWVWLNELEPGDHRLYTYGYSSRYVSELKISLSVPGPKA